MKYVQNEAAMNAWVLRGIGDISMETVKKPELKEGEVLVAVKAAGICGSDIPRIYQTGAYSYPLIPGHEFSGVVKATGADTKESSRWLGKRVGVFPLIPCGCCVPCRKRKYELCRNYSYLGSRRDGGFAQAVAVPEKNLLLLPDSVSFQEAAMLEPMAVAVHAMRRVEWSFSHKIVVCGLGTIGLLLVMFLREAGIKNLFVVGNKESQRQQILNMGLEEDSYCDGRARDVVSWILEHTDGAGADVFFECVGKNETYALAVDSVAPLGQICLVGNPYSDMRLEKAVYWKILRNQLTVTGTWNSSFTGDKSDDWHYVMERLAQKRVHPETLISHRIPFERLDQGLLVMRDKKEDYCKVMGCWES